MSLSNNLTVGIITTCIEYRSDCLQKCIDGVREFGERGGRVIIINQDEYRWDYYSVRNLVPDYDWLEVHDVGDIGYGAATNKLAELCNTEYFIKLDDDIIAHYSGIKNLYDKIRNTSIGWLSPVLFDNQIKRVRNRVCDVYLDDDSYIIKEHRLPESFDSISLCDMPFSPAIYRKEVFEEVSWAEGPKTGYMHCVFALDLKNKTYWFAAIDPGTIFIHDKLCCTGNDLVEYGKYRGRLEDSRKWFKENRGINGFENEFISTM